MTNALDFSVQTLRFDEDYCPSETTRLTTNFANLARGESRQENLRNTLRMIDGRFNALANWDNPTCDRYTVEIDIVSVTLQIAGDAVGFPIIEVLKASVLDRETGKRSDGMVGNSFSSYVRDYDFSVRLAEFNKGKEGYGVPKDFGALHGRLFRDFVASGAYAQLSAKKPVICLSVSTQSSYVRTGNAHPILGVEYTSDKPSLTDAYFGQMGLRSRYFMPRQSAAPLAIYFAGDLLNDYSNLELISMISTMETFQKIYRPEIYNANAAAGARYQPKLTHGNYSLTQIDYDRTERSQLAVEQGKLAEERLIRPYQSILQDVMSRHAA